MGAIGPIGQGNVGQNQQLRGKAQQIANEAIQQRQTAQAPGVPSAVPQVDQAQMSDELMDELDHKGGEGNGNVEEMLRGLANSFLDQKTQQPGEAGKDDGSIKDSKPTVERTAIWKPSTKEGEVLKAHDKIGDVEIKEKVTPAKNAGQRKKNGQQKGAQAQKQAGAAQTNGASPSGAVTGAATGSAAAKVGNANSAATVNKDDNGEDEDGKGADKVELSPESQAMAANLARQGVQSANGMSGSQPSTDDGTIKQAGKANAAPTEKTIAQDEVTTKAGGWNQTAYVRPEGKVEEGDVIRSYDKLDDMPDDLMTGLHHKDGQDANSDYQNKVQRGEKVASLNGNQAQMLQQMRNPVGNVT